MAKARKKFKGARWRDQYGRFVAGPELKHNDPEKKVARKLPASYKSPFRKYTQTVGTIHGHQRVVAVVRWSPFGGYRGKDGVRLTSVITLGQFTRKEARDLTLDDVREAFAFEKKGTLHSVSGIVAVKARSRRVGVMVAKHGRRKKK